MQGSNSQPPLSGPSVEQVSDFKSIADRAAVTGNYAAVIEIAEKSKDMLDDFKDAIRNAQFSGADAHAVGIGLTFLDQLIKQSLDQIKSLKEQANARN